MAHGETSSYAEERNSKTRKKTLSYSEGDGKINRWEEQRKRKVKVCGQEGECRFVLKKVEEEGTMQVKYIG